MEKLIRLPQLQRFKEKFDLKYQNKLVVGDNINITGNTISAVTAPSNPVFTELNLSFSYVPSSTITVVGNVTLMPGTYFLVYTCYFSSHNAGYHYRQCGFSTNQTDITGYGRSWGDFRSSKYGGYNLGMPVQTCVSGIVNVSASAYPSGQQFYLLARHNDNSSIQVYPNCSYVKLA